MAIATEESLKATSKVMYRGCSVCCASMTVLMLLMVIQSILSTFSTYTVENVLVLILVMVVGPALVSVILCYLGRQKRAPSAETASITDWSYDEP